MLTKNIRGRIFSHMIAYGRAKGIQIDRINGYVDHVHLLRLRSRQTIAEIMNLIKGESSRWVNKNHLTQEPFEWQTDYFASAVRHEHLERTRAYIDGQERHHEIS